MHPSPTHLRGLGLGFVGGMMLTFDIPAIRLAGGDVWSLLLVRSFASVGMALVIFGIWGLVSRNAPPLLPGRVGLVVAALYGAVGLTFLVSVHTTTTANLVFILAFNTMFAALLGWLVLGERPAVATFLAMAAMIAGVALIVSGSLKSGNWFGDFMALLTAFLIAAAITITRKSGKDMGLAPMIGVALPGLLALVMVAGGEGIRFEQPWWALIDGAIIMPVSMFCLAVAPRHISGPQVAMFYLLETVLTPVWVWMIFAERPDDMALAGGAIILAALAAHIGWQATARRRAMRARVPRRPA